MPSLSLERFVRFGFATKGALYGLMGGLALQAAFTHGGGTEDSSGVLARIEEMPLGPVLLALMAVGLAGYSVWRFVQAALDTDRRPDDSDTQAVLRRIGYAFSGIAYGALAFVAARGVLAGSVDASSDTQRNAARTLLGLPMGRFALVALGLVLAGAGVVQIVRGVKASFMRDLESGAQTTLACWAGRIGLCARGLVFGLVGVFFVQAGWDEQASEAAGTEVALDVLGRASPWLFAAVAAGFVAFALYCFIQARHRRLSALPLHA